MLDSLSGHLVPSGVGSGSCNPSFCPEPAPRGAPPQSSALGWSAAHLGTAQGVLWWGPVGTTISIHKTDGYGIKPAPGMARAILKCHTGRTDKQGPLKIHRSYKKKNG